MKTTPDQVRIKFGTSDSDKLSTHFAKLLQPIRSKNDPSEQLTLKEAYDAVVEMKNIPYEKSRQNLPSKYSLLLFDFFKL